VAKSPGRITSTRLAPARLGAAGMSLLPAACEDQVTPRTATLIPAPPGSSSLLIAGQSP
jgi:hypothetical protein